MPYGDLDSFLDDIFFSRSREAADSGGLDAYLDMLAKRKKKEAERQQEEISRGKALPNRGPKSVPYDPETFGEVTKEYKKPLMTSSAALYDWAGRTTGTLDWLARQANPLYKEYQKKTKTQGLGDKASEWLTQKGREVGAEGYDPESLTGKIITGATTAIPEILALKGLGALGLGHAALPALGAVRGGEQGGWLGAAMGGAQGWAMGKMLEANALLPTAMRPATGAFMFGAPTAIAGGNIEDVISESLIGAGLSLGGPDVKMREYYAKPLQRLTDREIELVQSIRDRLKGKPVQDLALPERNRLRQYGVESPEFDASLDAVIPQVLESHQNYGGSTFNLKRGNMAYKDLYAVSIFPDQGISLPIPGKVIPPDTARQWARFNRDLLKDPRLSWGTWYDAENNASVLDVVATIKDKSAAERAGRKTNQKAITYLKDLSDIKLGGTGEDPGNLGSIYNRFETVTTSEGKPTNLVRLLHFSRNLNEPEVLIDPHAMGKGQMGEESRQFNPDGTLKPGYLPKSAFYTEDSPNIEGHRWYGSNLYETVVDKDSLLIIPRGKDIQGNPDTLAMEADKAGWLDENTGQARLISPTIAKKVGTSLTTKGKPISGREIYNHLQYEALTPALGLPEESRAKLPMITGRELLRDEHVRGLAFSLSRYPHIASLVETIHFVDEMPRDATASKRAFYNPENNAIWINVTELPNKQYPHMAEVIMHEITHVLDVYRLSPETLQARWNERLKQDLAGVPYTELPFEKEAMQGGKTAKKRYLKSSEQLMMTGSPILATPRSRSKKFSMDEVDEILKQIMERPTPQARTGKGGLGIAQKKPWQMTRKEFADAVPSRSDLSGEDFQLYPERTKNLKKIAVLHRGRVYTSQPGEALVVHSDIIEEYRIPYNEAITGFVDDKGRFTYQYPDEAHDTLVRQALEDGKPVPQRVLKTIGPSGMKRWQLGMPPASADAPRSPFPPEAEPEGSFRKELEGRGEAMTKEEGTILELLRSGKITEDQAKLRSIVQNPEVRKLLRSKPREVFMALESEFVDRFAPAKKAVEQFEELSGKLIEFDKNIYNLLRLFPGRFGVAKLAFDELRDIIQPVRKYKAELEEYAIGERVKERWSRDIENPEYAPGKSLGRTEAMKSRAALYDQVGEKTFKKIQEATEKFYSWSDKWILKTLVDSSLISKKLYANIKTKNKHWFPFDALKYIEEGDLDTIPVGSEFFSVRAQDIIKPMTGAAGKIIPPFESIVSTINKTITLSEKNKVLVNLIKYRGLSPEIKKLIVPVGLTQKIGDPSHYEDIKVVLNGKVTRWLVPKDLGDTLKNMNMKQADSFMKIVKSTFALFRAGTTSWYLPFTIGNAPRDFKMALLCNDFGFNFVNWTVGLWHGLRSSFGLPSQLYKDYLKSGGSFSGLMARTPKMTVHKLFEPKGIEYAKEAALFIKNIASAVELAPRLGVFQRAMGQGVAFGPRRQAGSLMEAGMSSRNATIDFSKAGHLMKLANQYVPFINARLQAKVNLLGRIGSGDPTVRNHTIAKAIAWVVMPSLGSYLYNILHHPNVYTEIPDYVKDNYDVVIVGTKKDEKGRIVPDYYKLTKGDTEQAFVNPLITLLEFIRKKEPIKIHEMAIEWFSELSPIPFAREGQLSLSRALAGGIPPVFRAPIEYVQGKSLYTERETVPWELKRLKAEEQYTERTPKPYRALGKLLNQSPLKLQSLAKNLGGSVFYTTDIGASIAGRVRSTTGGESMNQAYKLQKKAEEGYFTVRKRMEDAIQARRMSDVYRLQNEWNREFVGILQKMGSLTGQRLYELMDSSFYKMYSFQDKDIRALEKGMDPQKEQDSWLSGLEKKLGYKFYER